MISLSANADDVCVLLRIQGDADIVKELEQYERASAKVNWGKSEAFLMGRWGASEKPRLPRGLQWDRADLKMLGVCLGSNAYQGLNWEGVVDKVVAKLSSWRWLLPLISFRGRVLVGNNLAASTLWHRLGALEPPYGLLQELQKPLVGFFRVSIGSEPQCSTCQCRRGSGLGGFENPSRRFPVTRCTEVIDAARSEVEGCCVDPFKEGGGAQL